MVLDRTTFSQSRLTPVLANSLSSRGTDLDIRATYSRRSRRRRRRYAAIKGIILAALERWDASDWFPDPLLSELVLLGELACRPLVTLESGSKSPICRFPLGNWKAG